MLRCTITEVKPGTAVWNKYLKKNQYQFKCMLYIEYFHHFVFRQLLSPSQPNFIGEIINFTSQNTGVSGLLLPRSVSLCYCVTLTP